MANKKILILLWHLAPYGATAGGFRVIYEILRRIPNDRDYDIDVLDVKPSFLLGNSRVKIYEYKIPEFVRKIEKCDIQLVRGLEWLITAVLLTFNATKLYKKRGYDLIYVPCAELFFTTFPALFLKWLFGTKIKLAVLNVRLPQDTFYNYYLALRKASHSKLNAFLLAISSFVLISICVKLFNGANEIITISNDLRHTIRGLGVKRKIAVIRIGIDFRSIEKIPVQDKKYDGIFIGRLSVEKGIYDLVHAWKHVTRKIPDAQLLFIGSSHVGADKLIQEIREKNLEQNITLVIPDSDASLEPEDARRERIIKSLKMSRLVVFLSRIEGWGLVPLEGLACGLPVIAYDLPIYKENIRNCEAAFLVSVGDYQRVAKIVINMLNKREQDMSELSHKAKEFASQYDWDKLIEPTINTITR